MSERKASVLEPRGTAATPPAPEMDPTAARPGHPRRAWIAAASVSAVLIVAYAPNLRELYHTWISNPDASHGLLVAWVALAILWRCWPDRDAGSTLKPSVFGLAALGVVLVARAVCYEVGEYWLETVTLVPAAAALLWAGGGWDLLRKTWPAAAYLVFMLSIPGRYDSMLSFPMQKAAAGASCWLLRSFGVWVLQEGNLITIGEEHLEVARACSGLAMLTSLTATVVAATLLIAMDRWKRVVLLASILPIALLCNILRIAGTVLCFRLLGAATGRTIAHDVAGWLMMPLALLLIGLELAWLSWLVIKDELIGDEADASFPTMLPFGLRPGVVGASPRGLSRRDDELHGMGGRS
ncbi:MAG: hypothetical protein JWN86_288 [Planctomycetota bacterium]|nr:hypothetical protein [Planctomycetota bacterium]